jgi:hypothetical protein
MSMLFSLEAVFARKGDALILHYGNPAAPNMIVIDGGPGGVYTEFLKPRLNEIRAELGTPEEDPLPLEMVMVSHIDDDHINGVIELFRDNDKALTRRQPLPYTIKTLWHNSFDDILGNKGQSTVATMAAAAAGAAPAENLPAMSEEARAVVASTSQGRDLRDLARKLKVTVNRPFKGLVQSPAKLVRLSDELTFTVISPDEERVAEYQKKWDKDLAKLKKNKKAKPLAFADKSPFNLASICVLAKLKTKTMLLTGDARGDFVLKGLENARLLDRKKPLHVDLFKVPHHGSNRNVEDVLFERVTADHYVISGDGEHGNPDRSTLAMIQKARGKAKYCVHFTFTADAHKRETDPKRRKALRAVEGWVQQKPSNCAVVFRANGEDERSILVDLLDPLFE